MYATGVFFLATVVSTATASPGYKDHVAVDGTCYGKVTVVDTETVMSTTVMPTTCYVEVTDYIYVNSTLTRKFTENTTKTLHQTVELTDTEFETETETNTETVTTTDTEAVTITTTDTDGVTITTTQTVPATVTTYTTETETLLQTVFDPCPKSCSIDAATVTLFYWPTDRPYSYPSTYVDEDLDYTFISPSVYMLIPSAKGTNTKGQHVGPSTTNWILGLDLDEVSTIADGPSGSLTRQLELSDLGTDCPQSMDPTAIATLNDSRCAPILAAPTTVSTWAYPCNACGRFGLFDPPYAVPTVTGLIEPTTTTEAEPTTTDDPTGTIYVVYHEDGEAKSTETRESVGMTGVTTSSVAMSVEETSSATWSATPETTSSEVVVVEPPPTTIPTDGPSELPTPSDPDIVATAFAHKAARGTGAFAVGIVTTLLVTFLNL